MNFFAKFTGFLEEVKHAPPVKPWQVFIDDLSCKVGGGVWVHIVTGKGEEHDYAINLLSKTTNNETEYEALFFGLMIAVFGC